MEKIMKSLKLLTLVMGLSSIGIAQAGESAVKWQDFDNYRDVRAANQSPTSFEKQITINFEKHFAKLAEKLPSGYKLNVEVADLDLAGAIEFSGAKKIRVIQPFHYPQIKRSTSRSFYYEKRLVTNWFHSKVLSNIS
jgi:hypothetical protein